MTGGGFIVPVPNQPKTPHRSVRVPDAIWDKALKKASKRDETLSDVIRKALEAYANSKD